MSDWKSPQPSIRSTAGRSNSASLATAETRAQTRPAAADIAAGSIFSLRIWSVTLSRTFSSLFRVMMFLQIVPNFFSQSCASAVKNHANHQWRGFHNGSNFFVVDPFVVAKNKHFASSLAKPGHSSTYQRLQFTIRMLKLRTAKATCQRVRIDIVDGYLLW